MPRILANERGQNAYACLLGRCKRRDRYPAAAASAQTVSTVLGLTNAGPVTSCPAVIKLGGVINVSKWPAGTRQLQYKWTFSDVGDRPTLSVTPPAGDITVTSVAVAASAAKSTSGWVQLMVTYPVNYASPKIYWTLVCPTPGSLGSGLAAPSSGTGGPNGGI